MKVAHNQQILDYIEAMRKPVTVRGTAEDLGLPEQTVRNVFNILRHKGVLKIIVNAKVKIYKRTSAAEEKRLHREQVAADMKDRGREVRSRINRAVNAKAGK